MKNLEQIQDLTSGTNNMNSKSNKEKHYWVYYADTFFYNHKFDESKQRMKSIHYTLPKFSNYSDEIKHKITNIFDVYTIENHQNISDYENDFYHVILKTDSEYPNILETIYNIIDDTVKEPPKQIECFEESDKIHGTDFSVILLFREYSNNKQEKYLRLVFRKKDYPQWDILNTITSYYNIDKYSSKLNVEFKNTTIDIDISNIEWKSHYLQEVFNIIQRMI